MTTFNAMPIDDDSLTWGVPSRRVGAFLIDGFLIGLLTLSLSVSFAILHVMSLGLLHGPAHLILIVGLIYESCFIASPAMATPGEMLVGLQIRRSDDLGRPTLLQGIAFTALLYLTLAAGVIWLGVAFFTHRRRTIHDMISGLVVVRAGALAPRRW
ncbi:RDD family protein [Acidisoma cellulosilytica]|uniref:RDD family protein n=1 Tax=Acidisoma cellulosilyticum TaxID=2802395 RepID=A0A963YXE3_9PROT|nr:RDD family protein [Acidisoma cellulosilyticum]MCB8878923.1 RDD family protein [Acidisoma cellulosilyticum]